MLDLNQQQIMGILNVTPDSFSDGGQFNTLDKAFLHAQCMVNEGADIIDVGGESTRPGAKIVTLQQELDRVIPVIEKIKNNLDVTVSIDSSKAKVMQEAKNAGAGLINDVNALQSEGALQMAYELNLPVCLMHKQGTPANMQDSPVYQDVVTEVIDFFKKRIDDCVEQGIKRNNLIIDPGFGFGKTLQHNLTLLKYLSLFEVFGLPILIGLSRKSLLQPITQRTTENRLAGSLALTVISALNGGTIFRVHDVKETLDVLKIVEAINHIN